MIKHIIFDIGGVFLKYDKGAVNKFIAENFNITLEKASEVWREKRKEMLVGKLNLEEAFSNLKEEFNTKASVDKLVKDYKKKVYTIKKDQINFPLIKLVEDLRKKYHLHVLTNRIGIVSPFVEKNIYPKFEHVIISHLEGMKKPDKNFYLHTLERIGGKPKETIFIDDLEINVKAAIDLGINGILYKNFRQLKKDLEKLGVK